jgi:hypothetical protein
VVFNVTSDPLTTAGNIRTTQTNVILTATNVNIPWWGRLGTSPSNNIASATPFTAPRTENITVPIPARDWQDASAWTGKITVQAGYAAHNGIPALGTLKSFTFDRDAFTITVIGLAEIAADVTSVTPTVTTNAPGYHILFKAAGASGADVAVIDNSVNSPATPVVTIAANNTYSDRTIKVVNYYDQAAVTPLASFVQKAKLPHMILLGPSSTIIDWRNANCPYGYRLVVYGELGFYGYIKATLNNSSTNVVNGADYYTVVPDNLSDATGRYCFVTGEDNNGKASISTGSNYLSPGDTYNSITSWYTFCIEEQ